MQGGQTHTDQKAHPPHGDIIKERVDLYKAAYLNLVPVLEQTFSEFGSSPAVLNQKDPVTGLTALAFSVRNNSIHTEIWLINHGASVDQKGYAGKTALMHAVQCGSVQAIEVLLKNNADVNAKDDHGLTAFMLAAANGNMKIIDILVSSGARIDQVTNSIKANALMMAVISTQTAVVDLMTIKLGDSVSTQDAIGRTVLHHAVTVQSIPLIERFIKLGADRNQADKQGKTPVDLATDSIRTAMTWV